MPSLAEGGPRGVEPAAVVVRRAARADAAAVAALLGALGYPVEPGAAAARLDALLGSARDAVLAAEAGGEVLGVLALHWGAMLHLPAPVARIGSLVVAEAARGRGVGALLVREAAALAAAEGCVELELTTGMRRHAAHAFYAAQGFAWTSLRFGRPLGGKEGAR